MTATYTYTSTWKPSLTDGDVAHLKAQGFFGAVIKGNPYRRHLKRIGDDQAVCGAAPGRSKGTHKMLDRTGWSIYEAFERPGCAPCAKCLALVEGGAA